MVDKTESQLKEKEDTPTCLSLPKGHGNSITKVLATPRNGIVYAAAEDLEDRPLFLGIAPYFELTLYRFGDPAPLVAETHVVYLEFCESFPRPIVTSRYA